MSMKIKRSVAFIIIAVCMVCLLGSDVNCATKGSTNLTKSVKVKTKSGRKMKDSEIKALSSSTVNMFDYVLENEKEDANVLISPTSILYAFGMAENGAKGTTKSQLEKVVNGGIKSAELNKILASTKKRMMKSEKVKWNVANSVWFINRKDVGVKKAFLKKVKSYYGAEIYKAPFNNKTKKEINAWVKKNTNKMIPKIINDISRDDVMYLINALAFEGEWAEQFNDRQVLKNQTFYNIDGSTGDVNMLSGKENSYFEINSAKGFRKKYAGYEYSFVGIQMPDGITPAQFIKQLSENDINFAQAVGDTKRASVYIKMPEFSYDYDIDLSDTLKNLGAGDAFDKEKANLYNMFKKLDDYNYYFSKVIHKTHIEVDKNGTKAAAATAIAVAKTNSIVVQEEKVEITLDHPFVYAIVDDTTNLPVFIGVVNSLK